MKKPGKELSIGRDSAVRAFFQSGGALPSAHHGAAAGRLWASPPLRPRPAAGQGGPLLGFTPAAAVHGCGAGRFWVSPLLRPCTAAGQGGPPLGFAPVTAMLRLNSCRATPRTAEGAAVPDCSERSAAAGQLPFKNRFLFFLAPHSGAPRGTRPRVGHWPVRGGLGGRMPPISKSTLPLNRRGGAGGP